ncbi:hypothetical protein TNCV_2309521 [Trichonephila clavipes]|nr:hypothetical protein TNCV_2309521 [Trichonephila clavipes]
MNGLDTYLFFIYEEAWLHLMGYVNSQNKRLGTAKNPHNFHHTPLHDQKVAVSAGRIIGFIFFHQTVYSESYISNILNPFVAALTEKEKMNSVTSIRMVLLPIHPSEP